MDITVINIHLNPGNQSKIPDDQPKRPNFWMIVLTAFLLPFLLYAAKAEFDRLVSNKNRPVEKIRQDTISKKIQLLDSTRNILKPVLPVGHLQPVAL
jgi:hypothetical protein